MSVRKQDIFRRDGTNPYFLAAVIGGVLVIIALLFLMGSYSFEPRADDEASREYSSGRGSGTAALQEVEADAGPESGEIGPGGSEQNFELEDGPSFELVDEPGSVPGKAGDPEAAGKAPTVEEWRKQVEDEWQDLLAKFESEGIAVDLDNKRVSVKGAIIRDKESPRYPIEYVVVSEGGNTHEALILLKATPSNINAALLSIGLEPGTTVVYRKKDPPPPAEDVESGKVSAYEVIPPKGTVMRIGVRYEGWGEDEIRPLEDLILDLRTRKSLERVGWVYVGSRFASVLLGRERVQKYMADLERNVVALYLTGYGNAIFDVNTIDGVDDSLFDVNPATAPPMGATVTLEFSL